MIRLFLAVLLPDTAREAAAQRQDTLRRVAGSRGVRWEDPAKFHFTLKFLGDTPPEQVDGVIAAAHTVAADCSPFTLALGRPGAFPNPRRPQILWLGAEKEVPVLTHLAESLDRTLARQGFPAEGRPFRPHLTLARVKSPEGARSLARALEKSTDFIPETVNGVDVFGVESFVLMQSELRPSGSVYTELERFLLTGVRC